MSKRLRYIVRWKAFGIKIRCAFYQNLRKCRRNYFAVLMANMYNNPFIIGINNNYMRQRPFTSHNKGYWYANTNHSRFSPQNWPRTNWQVTNTYRKPSLQNNTIIKHDLYDHLALRIHTHPNKLLSNTLLYVNPTSSVSYSISNNSQISEIPRNEKENIKSLNHVRHTYFTIEDAIRPQKKDPVNEANDLRNFKIKNFNEVDKHFEPFTNLPSTSPTILGTKYNKNDINKQLNLKVQPYISTLANLLEYSTATTYDTISTKSFNLTMNMLPTYTAFPAYTSTKNYYINMSLESSTLAIQTNSQKLQLNLTTINPLRTPLSSLDNTIKQMTTTQKSTILNKLYLQSSVSNHNFSSMYKQTQIKKKLRSKSNKNNVPLNNNNKKVYVKLESSMPANTDNTANMTKSSKKNWRSYKHPLISRNVSNKIRSRKFSLTSTQPSTPISSKRNETHFSPKTLFLNTTNQSHEENSNTQAYSSSESAIMRINNGYYKHSIDSSKRKVNTSIVHKIPNITVKNITNDYLPKLPIEIYFKKVKDL